MKRIATLIFGAIAFAPFFAQAQAPGIDSFTASTLLVASGSASTLAWSTRGAQRVVIVKGSDTSGTTVPFIGTRSTGPIYAETVFELEAFDSVSYSTASVVIEVSTTGIEYIHGALTSLESGTITIFDTDGKPHGSFPVEKEDAIFKDRSLARGMYLVRLTTTNGRSLAAKKIYIP